MDIKRSGRSKFTKRIRTWLLLVIGLCVVSGITFALAKLKPAAQINNLDSALAAMRFNTQQHQQSINFWDSFVEGLERTRKTDIALATRVRRCHSLRPCGNIVARLSDSLKTKPK